MFSLNVPFELDSHTTALLFGQPNPGRSRAIRPTNKTILSEPDLSAELANRINQANRRRPGFNPPPIQSNPKLRAVLDETIDINNLPMFGSAGGGPKLSPSYSFPTFSNNDYSSGIGGGNNGLNDYQLVSLSGNQPQSLQSSQMVSFLFQEDLLTQRDYNHQLEFENQRYQEQRRLNENAMGNGSDSDNDLIQLGPLSNQNQNAQNHNIIGLQQGQKLKKRQPLQSQSSQQQQHASSSSHRPGLSTQTLNRGSFDRSDGMDRYHYMTKATNKKRLSRHQQEEILSPRPSNTGGFTPIGDRSSSSQQGHPNHNGTQPQKPNRQFERINIQTQPISPISNDSLTPINKPVAPGRKGMRMFDQSTVAHPSGITTNSQTNNTQIPNKNTHPTTTNTQRDITTGQNNSKNIPTTAGLHDTSTASSNFSFGLFSESSFDQSAFQSPPTAGTTTSTKKNTSDNWNVSNGLKQLGSSQQQQHSRQPITSPSTPPMKRKRPIDLTQDDFIEHQTTPDIGSNPFGAINHKQHHQQQNRYQYDQDDEFANFLNSADSGRTTNDMTATSLGLSFNLTFNSQGSLPAQTPVKQSKSKQNTATTTSTGAMGRSSIGTTGSARAKTSNLIPSTPTQTSSLTPTRTTSRPMVNTTLATSTTTTLLPPSTPTRSATSRAKQQTQQQRNLDMVVSPPQSRRPSQAANSIHSQGNSQSNSSFLAMGVTSPRISTSTTTTPAASNRLRTATTAATPDVPVRQPVSNTITSPRQPVSNTLTSPRVAAPVRGASASASSLTSPRLVAPSAAHSLTSPRVNTTKPTLAEIMAIGTNTQGNNTSSSGSKARTPTRSVNTTAKSSHTTPNVISKTKTSTPASNAAKGTISSVNNGNGSSLKKSEAVSTISLENETKSRVNPQFKNQGQVSINLAPKNSQMNDDESEVSGWFGDDDSNNDRDTSHHNKQNNSDHDDDDLLHLSFGSFSGFSAKNATPSSKIHRHDPLPDHKSHHNEPKFQHSGQQNNQPHSQNHQKNQPQKSFKFPLPTAHLIDSDSNYEGFAFFGDDDDDDDDDDGENGVGNDYSSRNNGTVGKNKHNSFKNSQSPALSFFTSSPHESIQLQQPHIIALLSDSENDIDNNEESDDLFDLFGDEITPLKPPPRAKQPVVPSQASKIVKPTTTAPTSRARNAPNPSYSSVIASPVPTTPKLTVNTRPSSLYQSTSTPTGRAPNISSFTSPMLTSPTFTQSSRTKATTTIIQAPPTPSTTTRGGVRAARGALSAMMTSPSTPQTRSAKISATTTPTTKNSAKSVQPTRPASKGSEVLVRNKSATIDDDSSDGGDIFGQEFLVTPINPRSATTTAPRGRGRPPKNANNDKDTTNQINTRLKADGRSKSRERTNTKNTNQSQSTSSSTIQTRSRSRDRPPIETEPTTPVPRTPIKRPARAPAAGSKLGRPRRGDADQ